MDKHKKFITFILFMILVLGILAAWHIWTDYYNSLTYYPISGGDIKGNISFPHTADLIIMDEPEEDDHVANKKYVDKLVHGSLLEKYRNIDQTILTNFDNLEYLPLTGGTIAGDLIAPYASVPNPKLPHDITTKQYVDGKTTTNLKYTENIFKNSKVRDSFIPLHGGVTMKGNVSTDRSVNVGYPTKDTDAATLEYVDESARETKNKYDIGVKNLKPNAIGFQAALTNKFPLTGGTLQELTIRNIVMTDKPSSDTVLTNRKYVDDGKTRIDTNVKTNVTKVQNAITNKLKDDFATYVAVKGGTITGKVTIPKATVEDPEIPEAVANKNYIDLTKTSVVDYYTKADADQLKQTNDYLTNQIAASNTKDDKLYLSLTGGTTTGDVTMPMAILPAPTLNTHITNKKYVDSKVSTNNSYLSSTIAVATGAVTDDLNQSLDVPAYLPLTGGKVSGEVKVPSLQAEGVPTKATDVVNKLAADTGIEELNAVVTAGGAFFKLTGGTLQGSLTSDLILTDEPSVDTMAANKSYVDKEMVKASALPLQGGTMTGNLTSKQIALNYPKLSTHLVNLGYLKDTEAFPPSYYAGWSTATVKPTMDPTVGGASLIFYVTTTATNNVQYGNNVSLVSLYTLAGVGPLYYLRLDTTGGKKYKIYFKGSYALDTDIYTFYEDKSIKVTTFKANVVSELETVSNALWPLVFSPMISINDSVDRDESVINYTNGDWTTSDTKTFILSLKSSQKQIVYPSYISIYRIA